jgi:uncharacterized damage-inducible protein DinB
MLALIRDLYRHMAWADARHWSAILAHGPAQSDPELGERVFHIHAVQQIWLARCQGVDVMVPKADFASIEDFRHWARACHAALDAYLSLRKEEDLAQPISYRSLAGESFTQPLGDLLLHLAYHSQYHRAQSATRMRALGSQMPATDLVVWQREGRPAPAWD